MKEIRIHARAGQGAITTASLLGQAAFSEGKHAYAFPHFGAARMGAPMNAFVRIDDKPIRLRSQIYEPDYLIIVDATLTRGFNCFFGFKDDGVAVVSQIDYMDDLSIPKPKTKQRIHLIPANNIAMEVLGRPLGNTVLLGAFAKATGLIKIDSLISAIEKKFSGKVKDQNIVLAKRGYEYIKA